MLDDCGQSSSDSQIITIDDTISPVINTPAANMTVECSASQANDINSWLASNGGATATDACGTINWSNNFTGLSDDCGATGSATVTFTATDACGNTSTTTATFTIEDTTPPNINTPASNMTVECDGAGNVNELNAWFTSNGGANAMDDCSTIVWSHTTSTNHPCTGSVELTYTFRATDACGNYSETTAIFTIEDTTAPTIDTDAADMTVECDGTGNSAQLTAWLNSNGGASSSDTCGNAVLLVLQR